VTFFFDNHHSPELVERLRKWGIDAVHLRDQFSDQGLDDVQWMPESVRIPSRRSSAWQTTSLVSAAALVASGRRYFTP
jgi:hypothetical protein